MSILKTSKWAFIFIAGGVLLIFPPPLYAYLDPGTGSLMLQYIIGSVFAALVMVKLSWHRLLHFFKIRKTNQIETEKEQESGDS